MHACSFQANPPTGLIEANPQFGNPAFLEWLAQVKDAAEKHDHAKLADMGLANGSDTYVDVDTGFAQIL